MTARAMVGRGGFHFARQDGASVDRRVRDRSKRYSWGLHDAGNPRRVVPLGSGLRAELTEVPPDQAKNRLRAVLLLKFCVDMPRLNY